MLFQVALFRDILLLYVFDDAEFFEQVEGTISAKLEGCETLSDDDISALVAFLETLTDDSARDMSDVIPMSVPSGLSLF